MRRFASVFFLMAVLVLLATVLADSTRKAEAKPPKYRWHEPSQWCIPEPVDCDIIIVPG